MQQHLPWCWRARLPIREFSVACVSIHANYFQRLSNALNQSATYPRYNARGQILRSGHANHVVNSYAYCEHQRAKYEYDDAQSLKALDDSLSKRLDHTLHNGGQRPVRAAKGFAGVFRRQLECTCDVLVKVQEAIGRA